MAEYGFGIDVGGTTVKVGRFSRDGALLEKWEVNTDISGGGENIIRDISTSILENIRSNGLETAECLGAGMGVPGTVYGDRTVTCVNLGWNRYPAIETLEETVGFSVKCTNDANAASLGEMWAGSGKGYKNIIMMTLGTGVGCGVIIDGKLYEGAHGAAGEIGHIKVNPEETRQCNCGGFGCLEQYASANGNVRIAMDYLAECDTPSPLRSVEQMTSKICWDYAIEGDPVAVEIADRFSNYLGLGLAMTAVALDPEVFILGGGVSRTGEPLRRWVESYYKKYAFHACRNTPITLASLGNNAGMYGCMYMVIS